MGSTSHRDSAATRKRKQRFSEEQTKSLESMFESEERLEPGKKLQLADELGLQPRQVAIWFQNRRSRCKSKQLEREYGALRAEYEALQSSFEALKKEKLILNKQLQILVDLMEEPKGGESDDSVVKEEQSPCPSAAERLNLKVLKNPKENGMEKDKELLSRFSEEEGEPYMTQLAGGIPAWPEQHFCSLPSWPSDQLTDDASQWCEFWPMNV